jgi:menaquinone-dependent protoporphyrinogen oxidase
MTRLWSGSAVFAGHWMAEATAFVRRHRALLADRPTWLFSSGPIGTMAAKQEPVAPNETGELVRAISAREHRVFFGAWDRANADRAKLGLAERMVARWLPEGDFRDWAAIEAWAASIAWALQGARTAPR